MQHNNTYKKPERIKSRKQVEKLFKQGKSFNQYPFKLYFLQEQEAAGVKAGVAVSARNFKNATDRNRIKRQMREAYRITNDVLKKYAAENSLQVLVFFLYVDKTMPDYSIIKTKMQQAINRLVKELHETATKNS